MAVVLATGELRQRQPRVRDDKFLDFVRAQKCCTCGRAPSQAAHIRTASPKHGKRHLGKSEKPDDQWCVPLCAECHLDGPQAQHKIGEERFWRLHPDVDPFATALHLYVEFKGGAIW